MGQWLFLRGVRAYFLIGRARRSARKGDWTAAGTAYGKAAALTPATAAIWIQLGHSLKESSDHQPAIQAYRNALALCPLDENPYRHLGFLLAHSNVLEAKAVLARALCLAPDNTEVRGELADEKSEGQVSEFLLATAARQIARHLVPRRPIGLVGRIVRRSARKAASSGRWADAEASYRRLVARIPHDHGSWMQLGHALKEQGHFGPAEYAYRRAVITDVDAADAFVQLGHILKLQERPLPSKQAYILAWQIDPGRDDIRRELYGTDLDDAMIEWLATTGASWDPASINQPQRHQAPDPLIHLLSPRTYAIYERLKAA